MTSPASITNIPLELVQAIVTRCCPYDIARLRATCRRLHHICHDAFVFQASFLYHVDEPTSSHVANKSALRELLLQHVQPRQATKVWARLATAACQLPILVDELYARLLPYESVPWDNSSPHPAPADPALKNIIGALSTLAVLGYPTVNDFTVAASLTGLAARLIDPVFWQAWVPDRQPRVTLASQLAFCLATGMLGHRVLNNMPLLAKRVADWLDPASPESAVFRDLHDADSLEGAQAAALLLASVLPWLLHADVAVRHRDDLPHPANLPLLLGTDGGALPLPLPDGNPRSHPASSSSGGDADGDADGNTDSNTGSSDPRPSVLLDDTGNPIPTTRGLSAFATAPSWSAWLRGTVDALLDDLANGEWVGYYTLSFTRESQVDAPLRGMRFTVHNHHRPGSGEGNDPDEVRVTADGGVDGVGPFRLEGTVDRLTGRVRLMKMYEGAHAWCNEGTLTPVGIVGCWGPTAQRPFGFIWMYKREWARKRASCP